VNDVLGKRSHYLSIVESEYFHLLFSASGYDRNSYMNYKVINQLTENQITELVDLYKNEFWSKKRTYEDVAKMLAASDIIVALVDESEHLIGFTRVLTDFAYRATIYDVIIKPTHRNLGFGAKLMDALIQHPQLIAVESLALYCLPEMIPFYERWGFKTGINELQLQLMFRYNSLSTAVTNDYSP
jgi:GNAT superfamily N-acetyltransferase